MFYSEKEASEETDALVKTLNCEGATLTESSSSDFQTLTELTQQFALSSDMETDESEIIVESQEEVIHEEEVHTEVGGEEIEIESERANSPEEILPDVKMKTASVPPLRPLTIAPKPSKVPIAMKPVGGGQQLLLLQGAGSGQAIKLVSTQGQELNLANFSISRPITLKPAMKTLNSQGNISLVQPKPMVMKKFLAPGQKAIQKPLSSFGNKQSHFMVVQKADQSLKIVQSGNVTLPSPTKTITLQQAQEMGLLTNAKLLPQAQSTPKLLNKGQQKTIKLVPQVTPIVAGTKTINMSQLKSPTKILPATSGAAATGSGGKLPQRIIFKTSGTNQTILPSGQIIQVAGTQTLNSGQVHQINIPGKGMQYIKFVTTSSADSTGSSTSTVNTVVKATSHSASSGNMVLSEIKPVATTSSIAPKPIKPMQKQMSVSSSTQIVGYSTIAGVASSQISKVAIPMRHHPTPKPPPSAADSTSPNVSVDANPEPNGIRPRKPCNCTKSQCLKLYCDCFANGEFCYMCNCMNCFNNLDNEEHRNRAIKACLERNPNAFRPKIGKAKDTSGDLSIRKHTKGCNCKRSGCLKNYCECYEAKIACSNNCKCVGCRNIEDSLEKKSLRVSNNDNGIANAQPARKVFPATKDVVHFRPRRVANTKQPINFITNDVIEATCQCLLTLSDSAETNMQDDELTKRQIIEEFGRCLTEIIECSTNRDLN